MTWAERVGDLATQIALVGVNAARIVSVPVRLLAEKVDGLVTSLAERSESGIGSSGSPGRTWVGIIAAVAWGVAAVALRIVSIVTVFVRQVATAADDFLRGLAESGSSAI